jgi:N-acyl amino acid synthase of PEP-CTERM/exosortase system
LSNNIIDHFNEYFEVVPAISDELKNEVYKLRYQVFCVENEIFDSDRYPDCLEFDEFDRHSVHYLIRHRKSGNYIATTRLILPDTDNPEKPFPLEEYCEIDNVAVMQGINRKHLGEVSRFCVSETFKRRKDDMHTAAAISSNRINNSTPDERRTYPHILTLALIGCCIKASYESDIKYFYSTTEPALFRFVSGVGINLVKIGPKVNFHGKRWPTVIKISDMLDSVAEKNLEIWNLITNNGCFVRAKERIKKLGEGAQCE